MTVKFDTRTRDSFDGTTPFLRFWGAINDQRRVHGLTELTFGPARRIWHATWHRNDADPAHSIGARRT